jgi:hypothetical protein
VFLRLPLGLTSLLAMILAVALETSAIAFGRAHGAKKRHVVPDAQLSGTAKIILRVALPSAMALESGLAILRAILTGQIVTSIVLGVAAMLLWLVSAYISDHSYAPETAAEKRATAALTRRVRLRGKAERELGRQRRRWAGAWDRLRHEAATRLGNVQRLTSAVDAAIRSSNRTPAPWPLTPPLVQQLDWASGRLDPTLRFPDPPVGDEDHHAQHENGERTDGPPALPPGEAR